MQRRVLLAGFASVVAGWSQRSVRARQPVSGRSLQEQVAESERAFANALARRDVNAFASHISEEAVFFGAGENGRILRGKRAILDGWKNFFDGPLAPFSWTPDLVEVLESGKLALSSGPVRDQSGTVTGRFNSVWRIDSDGRWRVVFDRGSPVCR